MGATDAYVRRPFVLEGAAQGGIGAAAALLLLGALYAIMRSHFDGALGTLLGYSPRFLPWTVSLGIIVVGALLVATALPGPLGTVLGFLAVVLGTINVVGGFVVTDRMLQMFKARPRPAKPAEKK